LFFLLTLTGCGQRAAGGSVDLKITLQPAAEGPSANYLTVTLADATGAPVTDATVRLEGNMNHAGMAPVQSEAVTDNADGTSDGRYRVPFTLSMLGDWIITVSAERHNGSKATQDIPVTVTEGQVEVKPS